MRGIRGQAAGLWADVVYVAFVIYMAYVVRVTCVIYVAFIV